MFLLILKVACFHSGQNCVSLNIRSILSQVCAKKHRLFRHQKQAASILSKTIISSISLRLKTGNVLYMIFSKFHNMIIHVCLNWLYNVVNLPRCKNVLTFVTKSIFSRFSTWVTELWSSCFEPPRKIEIGILIP